MCLFITLFLLGPKGTFQSTLKRGGLTEWVQNDSSDSCQPALWVYQQIDSSSHLFFPRNLQIALSTRKSHVPVELSVLYIPSLEASSLPL